MTHDLVIKPGDLVRILYPEAEISKHFTPVLRNYDIGIVITCFGRYGLREDMAEVLIGNQIIVLWINEIEKISV